MRHYIIIKLDDSRCEKTMQDVFESLLDGNFKNYELACSGRDTTQRTIRQTDKPNGKAGPPSTIKLQKEVHNGNNKRNSKKS